MARGVAEERLASIRLCCWQCWYLLTGPTGLPSGDDRDCCSLFFHWENQCGAPQYNRQRQNNGAAGILQCDLSPLLLRDFPETFLFLFEC